MSFPMGSKNLARQIAGAIAWGAFFIFVRVDWLFVGAVLWVPILVWRERRRRLRYGFLPGAIWRCATVVLIVTAGVMAPLKHEDRRVGPLSSASVTLAELAAAEIIYPLGDSQAEATRISLPSLSPTRQEVIDAIGRQTSCRARVFHCVYGSTIAFGGGVGPIHVSPPPRRKAV